MKCWFQINVTLDIILKSTVAKFETNLLIPDSVIILKEICKQSWPRHLKSTGSDDWYVWLFEDDWSI